MLPRRRIYQKVSFQSIKTKRREKQKQNERNSNTQGSRLLSPYSSPLGIFIFYHHGMHAYVTPHSIVFADGTQSLSQSGTAFCLVAVTSSLLTCFFGWCFTRDKCLVSTSSVFFFFFFACVCTSMHRPLQLVLYIFHWFNCMLIMPLHLFKEVALASVV